MVHSSLNDTGVFKFDADAYARGLPPRFYGNPNENIAPFVDQPLMYYPGPTFTPNSHLSGHPTNDAFVKKEEGAEGESKSNSSWKKILAGILVGGLAVFGLNKIKPNLLSSLGDKSNADKKAAEKIKKEILEELGKNEEKIKAATEAKAGFFKNIGKKIKALPKWGKIAGCSILGLIVAGGIYKFFSRNHEKPKNQSE